MLLSAEFSGWFIVIGSASFVLLLVFFFLLFFQYSRRRQNHVNEMLRLKKQYDETLLQSQLEIQEQTFEHISYEIHDNIGQVLSLVRLNINTLNPENYTDKINDSDALLEKAIDDLRHLSHSLNANFIAQVGFVDALESLLKSIEKTGRYVITLENEVEDVDLPHDQTIILFRMVQELLNNIVKHAKASSIMLRLEGEANLNRIVVSDNGIGFTLQQQTGGMGLSTIVSRAKVIGATVDFDSGNSGTTATITLQHPKQR